MVKICDTSYYPDSNEAEFSKYFELFPYELSPFQKHSIEGIVRGSHVLVTAHTGSGKTLPAEFAIEYFVSKGKKVIYTAPIKALSNQKFYEFQKKFPHITFGILTGDIKANPIADVLIMTTEILMNTLYLKSKSKSMSMSMSMSESKSNNISADFEMDFASELGCVIFDEVHYINDVDRGRVWEETIMALPTHIQMVMLSATICTPEEFGQWIESIKGKELYLCSTSHRVVPLTHWSFITTNSGLFKKVKDKTLEQEFNLWANKTQQIQSSKGVFSDLTYKTNKRFIDLLENKQVKVSRPHILNKVCEYMVENLMLPALCFILSRKQLEFAANEVTTNLLEFDSKVPYTAAYECEQIIRKLPNYQEYLELPEYISMVKLIEKGIAIHHSGVLPILKEMVELLYAKGFIKLLFATETFSIGVNMPTKTVLFTDLTKFDGNISRLLYSHEYSQMAGRAGRRGIDTAGHVIHLVNLFTYPELISYKTVLCGKPQYLISKFKFGYDLVLNMIGSEESEGQNQFLAYASKSMVSRELKDRAKLIDLEISQLELSSVNTSTTHTPHEIIQEYIDISLNIKTLVNKKRKEAERRLSTLKDMYRFIDQDLEQYKLSQAKIAKSKKLNTQLQATNNFMSHSIGHVIQYLQKKGFVNLDDSSQLITLTQLGKQATHIKETHCLVLAMLLDNGAICSLHTVEELVGFLSCFTSLNVSDDYKVWSIDSIDSIGHNLKNLISHTTQMYNEFQQDETRLQINSGIDYTIHFDLVEFAIEWVGVQDVIQAKELINRLAQTKKIFLGEFVKAILKIVNIANELVKITCSFQMVELEHKLSQIPGLLLKFVATNQSLYV